MLRAYITLAIIIVLMLFFIDNFQRKATPKAKKDVAETILKGIY